MDSEAPPPYTQHAAPNATIDPNQGAIGGDHDYPPPPGISHNVSSGANASAWEADQAHNWCNTHQLWPPQPIGPQQLSAIHAQAHQMLQPNDRQAPGFKGNVNTIIRDQVSFDGTPIRVWTIQTFPGCKDTTLQTALPLYGAKSDRPSAHGQDKTIYFEVHIRRLGPIREKQDDHEHHRLKDMFKKHHQKGPVEEAGIALGYFAPPYPCFRLPGWERGSFAVHSDDGHRFVGNNKGGVDFTSPFREGETLGIGMTFKCSAHGKHAAQKPLDVEVFFTRNGQRAGGWAMRNIDGTDENLEGLMGENDLFAGVGVFGETELDVVYMHSGCMFRPW